MTEVLNSTSFEAGANSTPKDRAGGPGGSSPQSKGSPAPRPDPTSGRAGQSVGALAPGQRWSVGRKREVVLRLLRGESVDLLSRELGVEIYRLEEWREKALSGIDTALKERTGDPLAAELDHAVKRVGEMTMEIELLRAKVGHPGPFVRRKSRR